MFSKLLEIWSGLFIPDPDPDFLPIPDPEVKKAPDPGYGSATLSVTHSFFPLSVCFLSHPFSFPFTLTLSVFALSLSLLSHLFFPFLPILFPFLVRWFCPLPLFLHFLLMHYRKLFLFSSTLSFWFSLTLFVFSHIFCPFSFCCFPAFLSFRTFTLQCCGSGMFIPDPGSWFLPIPDP